MQIERASDAIFIEWPDKQLPISVHKRLIANIRASKNYAPPHLVEKQLTELAKRYNVPVGLIVSLRQNYIKDYIIKNYPRMNKQMHKIAAEYNAGADILDLSNKYDFPPLNLLRGILLYNGYSATDIYNVFAGRGDLPVTVESAAKLSGRDTQQIMLAAEHDADNYFSQQEVLRRSQEYEDELVDLLRNAGIQLKTQAELVAEQTATIGRAVATPDILFVDKVYINGVSVRWIDAKDMYYYQGTFLDDKIISQAAKYYEQWGIGAFCFHWGFREGISVRGALLLSDPRF